MMKKNGYTVTHDNSKHDDDKVTTINDDKKRFFFAVDDVKGSIINNDDVTNKENWSSQIEFLLSAIGYCVGLGNIWRFPYLCVQNGGGAFLIPYFTMLVLCGMPLLFLEYTIAQYSGFGAIDVWNLCPIMKGLGWTMVISSVLYSIFYNIIMTWILRYLWMSFQWDLDWKYCDNEWNTESCFTDSFRNNSMRNESILRRNMKDDEFYFNDSSFSNSSSTFFARRKSSLEEFWLYNTLKVSSGIDEIGELNLHLIICSAISWLIVSICCIRGIKSIGKVVYVTATLPYVFLTIIIIRGSLLPGSLQGLDFYLKPNWPTLLTFKVWATAATQIFYSLGPTWGGMLIMASYNKFNNNLIRDTLLVSCVCSFTSFYGGFAIFTMMGYIAHLSNSSSVGDVVQSGPGLAFVAYPQALSNLPGSMIWCILFFIMLYTVGLDSLFTTVETFLTCAAEMSPKLFKNIKRRSLMVIACCTLLWLLGFVFCTQGGVYLFQIIDWYSTSFSAMIVGLLECVAVAYFYGAIRLISNAEAMFGKIFVLMKFWCYACLYGLTPATILCILIRSCVTFEEPTFENTYTYPRWAIAMGWSFVPLLLLPIVVLAALEICKYRDNFKRLITPNRKWNDRVSNRLLLSENKKSSHLIANGNCEKEITLEQLTLM